MVIPESFYLRNDVVQVAKDLIGKILVTYFDEQLTSGMITETEAYAGISDKASHAYGNRRTRRTETMFAKGGVSYVYLCYGIHHLFNIVTNQKDIPHAVLIRAIEPVDGIEIMLERRNRKGLHPLLTSGPGVMTTALGIKTIHDHISLCREPIWIEDRGIKISKSRIVSTPRIGVGYAKEDACLPYRFYIKDSPFVSKGKI